MAKVDHITVTSLAHIRERVCMNDYNTKNLLVYLLIYSLILSALVKEANDLLHNGFIDCVGKTCVMHDIIITTDYISCNVGKVRGFRTEAPVIMYEVPLIDLILLQSSKDSSHDICHHLAKAGMLSKSHSSVSIFHLCLPKCQRVVHLPHMSI